MADPVTVAAAGAGAAAAVGTIATLEHRNRIGLMHSSFSSLLSSWSTEQKQQSYKQMQEPRGEAEKFDVMASIDEESPTKRSKGKRSLSPTKRDKGKIEASASRELKETTPSVETMLEEIPTPKGVTPKISYEASLEDGVTCHSGSVSELEDDSTGPGRKYLVPIVCAVAACILLVIAIVVGVVVHQGKGGQDSSKLAMATHTNATIFDVTTNTDGVASPTYGATRTHATAGDGDDVGAQAMTEAPTQALDMLLETLPPYTLESLQDPASPQFKAKEWLTEHPRLLDMSESRKLQLFVLATFYHSMDGPNWPNERPNKTWLNYSHHECSWHFEPVECFLRGHCHNVTQCNSKHEFVAISLQQLSLHELGSNITVPPEISLLTSLKTLSLYSNSISTRLEDFLPTQLYGMPNLMELNLRTNRLEGTIPSLLGQMTTLKSLSLAGNRLTGTIPTQLGLMKGLTEAYLWRNLLTGSIPTQLGQLSTKMKDLEVVANALTGQIPTQLALLTHMETLHMQQNKMTGEIPTEFGALTKLQSLSLRMNQLTGSIPSQIASISSLEVLRLEDNALEGSIPKQFGNQTLVEKLVRMTLHNNDLIGIVPKDLCSLGSYDSFQRKGLSFDCRTDDPEHHAFLDSDPEKGICGCDSWCPCWSSGSSNNGNAAAGTVGDND